MNDQCVVLVLYDGCVYQEAAAAVTLLTEQFSLRVLTPDAKTVRSQEGLRFQADGDFSSLPAAVRTVLLPGGNLDSVAHDTTLDALLQNAAQRSMVFGGICNGVVLLAKAGLLHNRRCTHTCIEQFAPRSEWAELLDFTAPFFAKSTYVDQDVVVDGPVITARPWAAHAFAETVAFRAGALSRKTAARRASYLRGERFTKSDDTFTRYAVHLGLIEGVQRDPALIRAHVLFLRSLDERGLLIAAGPFGDGTGGMYLLRARSLEEANAIAKQDPFVQERSRTCTVSPWFLSCEANGHLDFLPDENSVSST